MIISVTGATGFIGSHLVDRLIADGHTVRVLVRRSSNLRWLAGKPVTLIEGDIRNAESLQPFLAEADYIYHLAGLVKARTREEYFDANVGATRNMLEAAVRFAPGLRRFLFMSSQTAAGPAESLDVPLTEDMPCRPITTYGESKLAAENEVRAFSGRLPWSIVRAPAVFGPRDTEIFIYFQTISRGLNSMIGFGEKRLNLIYALDLVHGTVLAAEHAAGLEQTFFIASERLYTWPEIGRIVAEALGRTVLTLRIPHTAVYALAAVAQAVASLRRTAATLNLEKARDITRMYWICSPAKAQQTLGFREQFTIDEAIRDTVAWYRAQGWLK